LDLTAAARVDPDQRIARSAQTQIACDEKYDDHYAEQSSVARYMVKRRGPPSQEWRTFLRNHAPDIAAMDLFVVPTIGFDLLYAFVIVRLDAETWSGSTSQQARRPSGLHAS
jgi:hypothetical protein